MKLRNSDNHDIMTPPAILNNTSDDLSEFDWDVGCLWIYSPSYEDVFFMMYQF